MSAVWRFAEPKACPIVGLLPHAPRRYEVLPSYREVIVVFFRPLSYSTFSRLVLTGAVLCISCHAVFAQQLPAPAASRGKAPASAPNWQLLPDPAIPDKASTTLPEEIYPPSPLPEEMYPPNPVPTEQPTPRPRPTPAPTARPATRSKSSLRRASVGGVSIHGLSDTAASDKLRRALAPKLSAKVVLSDGAREYSLSRSQLGAKIHYAKLVQQARRINSDVPVRFEIDMATTQRALKSLGAQVARSARPARLDVEAGKVVFRSGTQVQMAMDGSAQRVRQAITADPPRSRVDLVVARTAGSPPSSTLRRFRYLLGSFSTPYDAEVQGRTNNLRIAAENVNGTIVQPGAIFSTNNAIGPRNTAAGWREAQMFVSGQVVSGIGAGICQCATTLYNAALLAGLPIVERHPHMFPVTYAPPSRDATLYRNHKDFRFRNTTGGPIYVQTFLSGARFYARLYGTAPVQKKIQIESRTLSLENGTTSEAYRVIESGNGTRRERLSRDYYKPHP